MGDDLDALLISLALFVLGATLAAIEASLLAMPEARLRAIRDERGDPGGLIERYLRDPDRVLTRLLAGRVFAPLMAMALATRTLLSEGAAWWHIALVLPSLAFFSGILDLLAVTLGRGRARHIAPRALLWSRPLLLVLAPVALPMQALGAWARRRVGERASDDAPAVTEREVEYVVEQAESAGAVDPVSSEMLHNVFEVKSLTARDVMVPRTKMVAIEAQTSVAEALRRFNEEGHSRVPVFREQVDHPIGTLHAKDLYRHAVQRADGAAPGEGTVEGFARRPPFLVSDTQPALSVLRDMQSKRAHLAIVVDEYGSVVGLVTLEDILEEIVGDIQDEHDSAEQDLEDLGEGRWLASAAMPVSALEEALAVDFPDREDYASLGGFLAAHAGRVPVVGTAVEWGGYRFVVREGDKRRATKVEIVRAAKPRAAEPEAEASA